MEPARCRLLALDLDGTLLRDDGTIDPRDEAAIGRAGRHGITVTLATGRWPQQTLPFAHALALQAPLICADGGLIVSATSGQIERQLTLLVPLRQRALELASRAGLPLLMVTNNLVLGLAAEEPLAAHLSGWATDFEALPTREGLLAPALSVLAAFVLGPKDAITAASNGAEAAALRAAGAGLEAFPIQADQWTLRVRPAEVHKGAAVATMALERNLRPDECGAVGDWYNDLTLLRWARFSFAMGQSPDDVAAAAQHRLRATAATGGGIAEAVDMLLAGRADDMP
jgi:Cof subfamily protein (haloacid dehalogenase superfamily)